MMPSFIFIFKIRRTDSLRRSSVISPVSTALMTAGTCTSKSVQHSISFPACTALTAISASPANCRTPSMTRSSVMITPSNPNSLRKIEPAQGIFYGSLINNTEFSTVQSHSGIFRSSNCFHHHFRDKFGSHSL